MVKPNINSVKVHPQRSSNGHPMDGSTRGCLFIVAVLKLHSMSIISSGHLVHPTLHKSFTKGVVHANSDMHVGATLVMSFSNFTTPSWCCVPGLLALPLPRQG
jgi:hypothetical protein